MAGELPMHSGAAAFRHQGRKLIGVLNRPAGREGARFPAVLFLHGFPGAEKNVDVQRLLQKAGVASFALYFSGAWGSEGDYRFSGLVPQAAAALSFLARRPFVDRRRLGVFGFSMGGWTAVNLAAERPGLVRALCAVAPVGGPEMIGRKTPQFVRRACKCLRVESPESLTEDFGAAVTKRDPARAAARLKCPVLLVHGEADEVVPCAVSRRLHGLVKGEKQLVAAPGARHDFLDRREWLSELCARWLVSKLT
jgi:dipeptidyl aminopeptidase/acylaminoacyl peptidase